MPDMMIPIIVALITSVTSIVVAFISLRQSNSNQKLELLKHKLVYRSDLLKDKLLAFDDLLKNLQIIKDRLLIIIQTKGEALEHSTLDDLFGNAKDQYVNAYSNNYTKLEDESLKCAHDAKNIIIGLDETLRMIISDKVYPLNNEQVEQIEILRINVSHFQDSLRDYKLNLTAKMLYDEG